MRIPASPAVPVYIALIVWLAAPTSVGAQVASVIEDGKRVFVNIPEPPAKSRGTAAGSRPASKPGGLQLASFRAPSGAPRGQQGDSRYSKEVLRGMATAAAERNQLDPALIHAVIDQESGWNPNAISSKGAQGLMQLMPAKAQELGVADAFDPEQNLEGGTRHLRSLLERYDGNLDLTLAAYNAGGGAVERHGGVPNYRETRNYVQRITDAYFAPGSGRLQGWWKQSRKIYRTTDETGKRIFTNE